MNNGRESTASESKVRRRDPLHWHSGIKCSLLVLLSLIVYGPALRGEFLWDDAGHVTSAELRSLAGLGRIWWELGATQQYYPLLHSAFWLEHRLWGDATLGYHLVNVLQHAGVAGLFGLLLRRLEVPGAWFAALCFALHPVGVESVAWIAEQKNTLSALFYLAAALAYLRFDSSRRPGAYLLAFGLFVLALLTKTVTATLPAALLVILWWKHGRVGWRREVVPLLPWLVVGAIAGMVTAELEKVQIGAQGSDFDLSAAQRGLLAARVIGFYLGKLIWPSDLGFVYPRWTVSTAGMGPWIYPLAVAVLLAALVWRRRRGPLAGLLVFMGTLFPVLGFVNVYPFVFSFVADHFQYLASLAVFALAGAAVTRLPRRVRFAVTWLVALPFGLLTWGQAHMYQDDITLFRTTLAKNPNAWLAHNNLGVALVNAGRPGEAIAHFETVLRLHPNYAEAENNLGDGLTRIGRPAEAIPHLERAVKLQPRFASARNNLGAALLKLGRSAEGIAHLEEALRLKPGFAIAHFNLGLALANSGRTAEAAAHFEKAVRNQPNYAEAELNWAVALTLTHRLVDAVVHFERALALRPDYAEAEVLYGRALATSGKYDDAIAHYRRALELNPAFRDAHFNLALALKQVGRTEEAERHLAEARQPSAGGPR